MRITRVYRFAASHRLHASELPEERNWELYGKCNNPYGHGHNYTLHISVSGDLDEATGRIVDLGALDRYLHERVIAAFDHKDMNADVDDFKKTVPTTENLAIAIAGRLRSDWGHSFGNTRLERIFIEETPRNTFELRLP
jgi:6-pyruvoyltetrahydropterin/6-carboxytetrahydropterin synthase